MIVFFTLYICVDLRLTTYENVCWWDTLKYVCRHRILYYTFLFFLDLGSVHYTHFMCIYDETREIQKLFNICETSGCEFIYTLVIVLFLSPHYSEFLFLDIVHDRISGFTSCREKKKCRTPSNQWIPLPYYGCLLYIKKRNSILTIIYHISFSDYNNMCVLWRATSALLLSILNKNSIFLNRSFSPKVQCTVCILYVVCKNRFIPFASASDGFQTEIKLFLYTLPILMVE